MPVCKDANHVNGLEVAAASGRADGEVAGRSSFVRYGELATSEGPVTEASDDPLFGFTEWASEADEMAYRNL